MTTSSTQPTGAHVCPHCDDPAPHEHVDTRAVVELRRATLLRFGLLRAGIAATALVLLAVLAPSAPALLASAAGMLAWTVCTAGGLAGALMAGRTASTMRRTLVAGLVGAALTPAAACAVAVVLDGAWWVPAGAAAGWLAAAAAAEAVRVVQLRRLLVVDTRPGEVARSAVVRLRETTSDGADLAWAVATAAVFGLWVLLCSVLPVLVLVLVPLHVVLVVVTRRTSAQRADS